jgi:hypothetical protein
MVSHRKKSIRINIQTKKRKNRIRRKEQYTHFKAIKQKLV